MTFPTLAPLSIPPCPGSKTITFLARDCDDETLITGLNINEHNANIKTNGITFFISSPKTLYALNQKRELTIMFSHFSIYSCEYDYDTRKENSIKR